MCCWAGCCWPAIIAPELALGLFFGCAKTFRCRHRLVGKPAAVRVPVGRSASSSSCCWLICRRANIAFATSASSMKHDPLKYQSNRCKNFPLQVIRNGRRRLMHALCLYCKPIQTSDNLGLSACLEKCNELVKNYRDSCACVGFWGIAGLCTSRSGLGGFKLSIQADKVGGSLPCWGRS